MAEFMDIIGAEKVTWDIEEFKEYDTQGSGFDLDAKLAPSKWKAALVMRDLYNDAARKIAAAVRYLDGAPVMIYDPSNPYPFADPNGVILGASTVQINSIGGDNKSLSLKGLPANYVLTAGDKGQVVFASGARNYFFEFSDDVTASAGGITAVVKVWPALPVGVIVNAVVNLAKPSCKMKIGKQGFAPGQSSGNMTFGTSVTLRERL